MRRYRSDSDVWIGMGWMLLALVILLVIAAGFEMINAITVDRAVERFYEISNAETIEVVRHTNNYPLIGDPHDVTLELKVDGQYLSGRCTSGMFSPMVCRMYGAGGD